MPPGVNHAGPAVSEVSAIPAVASPTRRMWCRVAVTLDEPESRAWLDANEQPSYPTSAMASASEDGTLKVPRKLRSSSFIDSGLSRWQRARSAPAMSGRIRANSGVKFHPSSPFSRAEVAARSATAPWLMMSPVATSVNVRLGGSFVVGTVVAAGALSDERVVEGAVVSGAPVVGATGDTVSGPPLSPISNKGGVAVFPQTH